MLLTKLMLMRIAWKSIQSLYNQTHELTVSIVRTRLNHILQQCDVASKASRGHANHSLPRSGHISTSLIRRMVYCIHWIFATDRIKFKLATLTSRCPNGTAPRCLSAHLPNISLFLTYLLLLILQIIISSWNMQLLPTITIIINLSLSTAFFLINSKTILYNNSKI